MTSNKRFLEERQTGIGGSDIAVILGVSPFGRTAVDVWRDKLGLGPSQNMTPTGPMLRGKILEPIAAKEYSKETGRSLALGGALIRHPTHDYLIAHIDAKIRDEESNWSGVLEIKIPNIGNYLRYKREGLGDYIQLQLQHYLGVTGGSWGSMWIWNPELWQGYKVDVKRDEAVIDMIFDKAAEFWGYVLRQERPPVPSAPEMELPVVVAGELTPMADVPAWHIAARDLAMATELRTESELIYTAAKERILEIMGPLTAVEGAGLRVYNSESPGRRTVDKNTAVAEIRRLRKLVTDLDPERVFTDDPEKLITKQGKPFKVFKPYFIGNNLIE
jgi:putative phage-type endonuclease